MREEVNSVATTLRLFATEENPSVLAAASEMIRPA
jgi:hypothetical protein